MSKAGLQLVGDKQLARALKELGGKVHRRHLRAALTAASVPVAKAAQANAPEDSGTLKLALKGGRKTKTYKASGTIVAIIGPRRDVESEYDGQRRVPANYAHLVEKGWIDEYGHHHAPAPFLGPAFDATQGQAQQIITRRLAKGVVQEAAKAAGGRS